MNPLDAFGPGSWTCPEMTSFGRVPMSTYFARPSVQGLDGLWSFRLRERPEEVTEADLTGPTETWQKAAVPGCWTMQGFDRPQYTNTTMPFDGPPPRVPDDNPTGVYRRRVTLPTEWSDKIDEFFSTATVSRLTRAGHFSPLEAAEPFAAAIAGALAETGS